MATMLAGVLCLALVTLADAPSPAVGLEAVGEIQRLRRVAVDLTGPSELAGKRVTLFRGDEQVGEVILRDDAGRATAQLTVPTPPRGAAERSFTAVVEGLAPVMVRAPDIDEVRATTLMREPLQFNAVFDTNTFPTIDFRQPVVVEECIGNYQISTTFYDRAYNQVEAPAGPGRYGAVITITSEEGQVHRRFRTLFKPPKQIRTWRWELIAELHPPAELEIDPQVLAEHRTMVGEHLGWQFLDGAANDAESAAILAALYEGPAAGHERRSFDDSLAADREWWVGLKRRLYAMPELSAEPVHAPRTIDGPPAPVLREGSLAEAGVNRDAIEKIDAHCATWAADSDEAFTVCIARRGVIVLHKAYGTRNGRPMTLDTPSGLASITKTFSGTALMMLISEGHASLDDPVDKFLPAFRGTPVAGRLTIRHLVTHSAGMAGHWGEDRHDLEELLALTAPYLEVGKTFAYNGTSIALSGKIVEAISGKSLPRFYGEHLFGPLGCGQTEARYASFASNGTALDLARFGQMLLNRGRYGELEFINDATFQQMLPPAAPVPGREGQGVGVTMFSDEGLGQGTFGHGAATSTTFRIDPVNELVIAMTRNAAGSNFKKYHEPFLRLVGKCVTE